MRFTRLTRLTVVACLALAAFLTASPTAADVAPRLLANLNQVHVAEPPTDPWPMGRLGDGRQVYLMTSADHGREPWVTDGTPGGTHLVSELCPGPCSLLDDEYRRQGHPVGGRVVFFDVDGTLWATDGTAAGTRALGEWEGRPDADPGVVAGGRLFLLLERSYPAPTTVVVTDGTVDGTHELDVPELEHRNLSLEGAVAGRAVISVRDDSAAHLTTQIWLSDGTAAGTLRLDLPPGSYSFHRLRPDLGVFARLDLEADRLELWSTAGSPATTGRYAEIAARDVQRRQQMVGGGLLWLPLRGAGGEADWLWVTDGTADGTLRGPAIADFDELAAGGDTAFWSTRYSGLRSSRPSQGSVTTEQVCDTCPADVLTLFRGGVVTPAADGLWWFRGGPGGGRQVIPSPRLVLDGGLPVAVELDGEERIVRVGHVDGVPALAVADFARGREERVWTSGEEPPLGFGYYEAWAETLRPADGGVVFPGDDGEHGKELWATDGSASGTRMLADVSQPLADRSSDPGGYSSRHGRLYFSAFVDGEASLVVTDGRPEGTDVLTVVDGVPDPHTPPRILGWAGDHPILEDQIGGLVAVDLPSRHATYLGHPMATFSYHGRAEVGSYLLLTGDEGLIRTDGTTAGTLVDRGPELGGVAPLDDATALVLGGRLDPLAPTPKVQRGLWRVEAATGAYELVRELEGELGEMIAHRGVVYFVQRPDPTSPATRIWRSDGTAAGTRPLVDRPAFLVDLTASGGRLYFRSGGLVSVDLASGRVAEHPFSGVEELRPFRGGLLFTAKTRAFGEEMVWTDGSPEDDRVLDLVPGLRGSRPRSLVVHRGRAYAFADDADHLHRLAVTDGTPAGTFFIDSPDPGLAYDPRKLAAVGDHLVFRATGRGYGSEPWTLDLAEVEAPGPVPQAPSAPSLRTGTPVEGRILLEWQPPARGPVDHYLLEYRRYDDAHYSSQLLPGDRRSVLAPTLDRVPALFRLRAVNAGGVSPPSRAVAGTSASPDGSCDPVEELCLAGDRFRVEVFWRDPRSGDAGRGTGTRSVASGRTGVFWFFRAANVEVIVKVLDGGGTNGFHWVFAGGLTDLEYFVVVEDTLAGGRQAYHKPAGDLCGLSDTSAFPVGSAAADAALTAAATGTDAAAAATAPGDPALSLLGDRFRVTVDWRDPRSGDTGTGIAIPGSDNTGYFWFFRRENVELVVKVLDGELVNGHRWVFYGGLTDVEYTLRVEDLVAGGEKSYHHAPGDLCGGADTTAF